MLKTNAGLVEYCEKQVGNPYWWGTFGQKADRKLLEQKSAQYPSHYLTKKFEEDFGKKVHDCVGLIKGYLWTDVYGKIHYNASQDRNVIGMLSKCTEIGNIKEMPEIKGLLVFMPAHVGVYVGNGEVIEARGRDFGVVKTKLKDRRWQRWGKLEWIQYDDVPKEKMIIEELKDKYGEDPVRDTISKEIEKEIASDEPSDWAKRSVEKLKLLGITDGSRPKQNCTREEMMTMIARAIDYIEKK